MDFREWENHSAFTPEIITPEQFADLVNRRQEMAPELRLLSAILLDAERCYLSTSEYGRARRLAAEAARWIDGDETPYTWSFNDICEALGEDPNGRRAKLHRCKAQGLPAGPRTPRYRRPVHRVGGVTPVPRPAARRSARAPDQASSLPE